jgi:hypothetical protein
MTRRSLDIHADADKIIALLADRDLGRYERVACETPGCLAPAPFRCSWPVLTSRKICAIDFKVDDVILLSRSREGIVLSVQYLDLRLLPIGDIAKAGSVVVDARFSHGVCSNRFLRRALIWVRRLAPCGAYACEQHVREVGEARHYCAAHWRSWEGVS